MTPDKILQEPARVLSQQQREHYFEHGYVGVEDFVPAEILLPLQQATESFVDKSRAVSSSDDVFDIGPGHSEVNPVLRRLKSPDVQSELYWAFTLSLIHI